MRNYKALVVTIRINHTQKRLREYNTQNWKNL